MKNYREVALSLVLFSQLALSGEFNSPMDNVDVFETESKTLSLQNLSLDTVSIDIYGEIIQLEPASGIKYDCKGSYYLELQIKNNQHEYFEVPCQSRIVFGETFRNQDMKQGY